MKNLISPVVGTMITTALLGLSPLASGATAVVDLPASYFSSNRPFNEAHGNGMIGWTFTVTSAITITQVGWYDDGGNGLSRDFQVGLWQAPVGGWGSANEAIPLLGDDGIVIPAGTGTSYNGLYRYIDLAGALTLQPGSYQIGGLDSSTTTDPIKYFWSESVPSGPDGNSQEYNLPGVTYGAFFYTAQTSADPGFRAAKGSEFYLASGLELGPMLFAIPEPSAMLLAGAGVLFLLPRRRARS